jgi:hypothetical protein
VTLTRASSVKSIVGQDIGKGVVTPGTAGVAQRVGEDKEEKKLVLKRVKRLEAITCKHNQY